MLWVRVCVGMATENRMELVGAGGIVCVHPNVGWA
jgi:hypothetical protein